MASGARHTIKSPGYDNQRYYLSYQGCSWWIKVINTIVLMLFINDLIIVCVYKLILSGFNVRHCPKG